MDGSHSILSCTAQCNLGGESLDLMVTMNEQVYFNAGLLTCYQQPELINITPKFGVESGGYLINAIVKYPVNANLPVYCLFGMNDDFITASATVTLYRSDEKFLSVFCPAPKLSVGLSSVRVAFGSRIVSLPQSFEVNPTPSIIVENHIFKFPNNSNDIVVTMLSKNLISEYNNQGFCQVNGSHLYAVPIIFSEKNTDTIILSCNFSVLNLPVGSYDINLLINDAVMFQFSLELYAHLELVSIHPNMGLTTIDQSYVFVNLDNPIQDTNFQVYCKFDSLVSIGTLIDKSSILCRAPAVSSPRISKISVSFDGNLYSNSLSFTYIEPIQVNSIVPQFGASVGGTTIVISGTVFHEYLKYHCVFGMNKVAAEYIS